MRDDMAGFFFVIPCQHPVIKSDCQLRHLEFVVPGTGYVFDEMGQAIAEESRRPALERLQALDRRCRPLPQPQAQELKRIGGFPAGGFIGGAFDPISGAGEDLGCPCRGSENFEGAGRQVGVAPLDLIRCRAVKEEEEGQPAAALECFLRRRMSSLSRYPFPL